MEAVQTAAFQYNIALKGKYMIVELSGKLEEKGIREATEEILKFSVETGIRRILYDATGVKQSDESRKSGIRYFKIISKKMERLASYIPDRKIYSLAIFMSFLASAKNWKPFRSKDKAIAWLEA